MATVTTTTVPCACCDLPSCCGGRVAAGGTMPDTLYVTFYGPGGAPGVCAASPSCTSCPACSAGSGTITLTWTAGANSCGGFSGKWTGTGTVTVCGMSQTFTLELCCEGGLWSLLISGGCFGGTPLPYGITVNSCDPFYACVNIYLLTPGGNAALTCFGCATVASCYDLFSVAISA